MVFALDYILHFSISTKHLKHFSDMIGFENYRGVIVKMDQGVNWKFVAGISAAALVGSLVIMMIVGASQGWFSSTPPTTTTNTNDVVTKKSDGGPKLNLSSNEDESKVQEDENG